jgi:ribonuclease HI
MRPGTVFKPDLGPIVYCDGASRKDGRGGWGFVVYVRRQEVHAECGGEYNTTNQRMELFAAVMALLHFPAGAKLTIYSDSQYVIKGITEYMDVWARGNWRTSSNKPLKNADLWEQLGWLDVERLVTWRWVAGHSGDEGNDRADQLATQGVPEHDPDRLAHRQR